MFVLMVAELSPVLSDATPALARRAQLGNRFQYWCGHLGKRYLFSAVPFDTLGDFRRAVVLLAEPAGDGHFIAWAAAIIDPTGRIRAENGSWPLNSPTGSIAFVHFLAETDSERRNLISDLFPADAAPALPLAA